MDFFLYKICKIYSISLLNYLNKNKKKIIYNNFKILLSIDNSIKNNIIFYLKKKIINKKEKKKNILELFNLILNINNINKKKELFYFVNLLFENNREMFLFDIAKEYISLYEKNNFLERIEIISSYKIKNILFLKNYLKNKLNLKEIYILKEKIDKKLIGGFYIKLHNQKKEINFSIINKLNKFKQLLN